MNLSIQKTSCSSEFSLISLYNKMLHDIKQDSFTQVFKHFYFNKNVLFAFCIYRKNNRIIGENMDAQIWESRIISLTRCYHFQLRRALKINLTSKKFKIHFPLIFYDCQVFSNT